MSRKLWTVLADRTPVAVVAAEAYESAWAIVAALDEHADLPAHRGHTQVVPCPPGQRNRTVTQAHELGCGDSFLACVRGGMFLTHIEGLS